MLPATRARSRVRPAEVRVVDLQGLAEEAILGVLLTLVRPVGAVQADDAPA